MKNLILHIGLPKTGTTFLQHQVFDQLSEWRHIHREHGPASKKLCDAIKDCTRTYRSNKLPNLVERVGEAIRDLFGPPPSSASAILSHEPLSVGAIEMWDNRGVGPRQLSQRLSQCAALFSTERNPKVLVGIRRQDHWLAARYAESCRGRWSYLSQADFDNQLERILDSSRSLDRALGLLDLHDLHQEMARSFGPENVHILPVEHLRSSPGEAAAQLAGFAGDDEYAKLMRATAGDSAHRNALSERPNTWRRRDGNGVITLSVDQSAAIVNRFGASNRRLAAAIGLPLGDYGYFDT